MKNKENLKEVCGIYKATNIINNKVYIGQSVNIKRRVLYHHMCDYNNEKNSCYSTKFYQAIRKYGVENFNIETIEECNIDSLNDREVYWISYYDSYVNGYNSTEGGNNFSEKIHSNETEEKRKKTLSETKALQAENHPRAKLKNEEVLLIRDRYKKGESCKEIYEDYKDRYNSLGVFKDIVFGETYKSVGNIPKKEERRKTNARFTAEQVREIRKQYAETKISQAKIAKQYGVSESTIRGIIVRRTYKDIE